MKAFINTTETYYSPIAPVLSGKWGVYSKLNGINYSEKKMVEKGYSILKITNEIRIQILNENKILKEKKEKEANERFLTTLTEITFTFENGKKILSVSDFKNGSENIGQQIQGSDAHENFVMVNGEKMYGRKHWSSHGIGIWMPFKIEDSELKNVGLGDYVGDIFFIEGKTFLRKK